MRITILGCGGSAGVPQLGGADGRGDWGACDPAEPRNRRSRSSIAIEAGEAATLLVDTGPELHRQLLDCGIGRVDAILYTHAHADHVAGLDDVRILNRLVGRPLEVFATPDTLAELQHRFSYAFQPWTGPGFFRPVLLPRPIEPWNTVDILGLPIRLLDQDHGFVRTLGLRIGNFAYCTDVATLDEAGLAVLEGLDTWVVDCFQRRPHKTHASLDRVREWSARIGARRTILTHMSYDLDWAWMERNLPPGFEAAHDGMRIELPA